MYKNLIVFMVCNMAMLCCAMEVEKSCKVGLYTYINERDQQQDSFYWGQVPGGSFYAVYDGHGEDGEQVAELVAENLHKHFNATTGQIKDRMEIAFKKIDQQLVGYKGGSTASVVFVDQDNVAYFAHVGDSRALLARNGNFMFATQDHKASREDEKQRIIQAGGFVAAGRYGGPLRVNGVIEVSRALGDHHFDKEKKLVIYQPECSAAQLHKKDVLVLASDGLWDKLSNEQVVAIMNKYFVKDLNHLAKTLANCAIEEGSLDNITVLVVDFS